MPVTALDHSTVEALPYLAHREKYQCIYWDAALPGFGVRVYPSGRRAFVCAYRLQGRKRLAVLGRVPVLTLDEARTRALSYLRTVAAGEDPREEDPWTVSRRRRAVKTVAELCAAFIEHHAKVKRLGWRADESCLRRRLLPRLKHRLAASIVSGDLEPIHAEVGRQITPMRRMNFWRP